MSEQDLSFRDPLSVSLPDYGHLKESDIPLLADRSANDELLSYDSSYRERSYYWEISSLSPEEMGRFFAALKNKGKSGG